VRAEVIGAGLALSSKRRTGHHNRLVHHGRIVFTPDFLTQKVGLFAFSHTDW